MNSDKKYYFIFNEVKPLQTPVIKQMKGKEFVYFGEKNDYPNYLIYLLEKSPTHNAIINGKINFVNGNSLLLTEYSTVQDLAKFKVFEKSVNEHETLAEFKIKVVSDKLMFGGYYIEAIKRKDGTFSFYHLPFQNVRKSEDGEHFYYTKEFGKNAKPQNAKDWKILNKFTEESGGVIDFQNYRVGQDVYPVPDYVAAVTNIDMEGLINDFLHNNIANGMSAGYIVNLYNGMPDEDEKLEIERRFKDKFQGVTSDKVVINFGERDSKSAEILPIPTNGSDDRFNLLIKQVRDTLFTAHQVTSPMLFGVKTEGQLGGRAELLDAFELFNNTYIQKIQNELESDFEYLLSINNINVSVAFEKFHPYGIDENINQLAISIGNLSPLVANKVIEKMTDSEVRALVGLDENKELPIIDNNSKFARIKSNVDNVITSHFASCGIDDEDCHVIYNKGVFASNLTDLKKQSFATVTEANLLILIKSNSTMPIDQLRVASGLKPKQFDEAIEELKKEGYIKARKDGTFRITKTGIKETPSEDLVIVYKYALRPDAPSLRGESRDFCKRMMALSTTKSWTFEQIEQLRNGQGLDVFESRGGWYTNPITGRHTAYCRHRWEQRIVKMKKK